MQLQVISILIGVLGLFGDWFKNLFKSKEAKAVGLAVVIYFVYTRLRKGEIGEENKELLNTSPIYQDAATLHTAFHPLGKIFGWYVWDGTDEKTALAVANRNKGKFNELSNAYNRLYNLSLVEELHSEGIYNEFMALIGGTSTAGNDGLTTGREYAVKGSWNIRRDDGTVVRSTTVGEIFKVLDVVENATLSGIFGDWVLVEYYTFNLIRQTGWIAKGAFN